MASGLYIKVSRAQTGNKWDYTYPTAQQEKQKPVQLTSRTGFLKMRTPITVSHLLPVT